MKERLKNSKDDDTVRSKKTYWDWVGASEESFEPFAANPDKLPQKEGRDDEEKELCLRAIREARLTRLETLVINLLLDMTQEAAALHLGVSRGAITGALERAREKIRKKLAILRLKQNLAD